MSATHRLHLRTEGLAEEASTFLDSGVLDPGPLWLVDTAAGRFDEPAPRVLLGLALVVQAQNRGHVGLDIARVRTALPVPEHRQHPGDDEDSTPPIAPAWPDDLGEWEAEILASPMVGEDRPFRTTALDDGATLLISHRMSSDQERLAEALKSLAGAKPGVGIPPDLLERSLHDLFAEDPDSQGARALRAAAAGCLTVITGGPGTGKTWSIKRLLAVLLQCNEEKRPLRIVLAAPTGKAAVRMTEAMGEELEDLAVPDEIKETLSKLPARTVHKLLRIRPDSGTTRFGKGNPLPADVVVVDEASMLDLVLMRKLIEAVPEGSRLVLLGDRDQLASVEAGTVLADVVGGHFDGEHGPLEGRIVAFTRNYRFDKAPTVAAVAEAIQADDEEGNARAVALMMGTETAEGEDDPDRVQRLDPQPEDGRPAPELLGALAGPYLDEKNGYAAAVVRLLVKSGRGGLREHQRELLDDLDKYRVLAVHRRGPLGVSGLLRTLGDLVKGHILQGWRARPTRDGKPPDTDRRSREQLPSRAGLWLGQPVLVTQNAYDVDLRNGDIGLVLPTKEFDLAVVFPVSRAGSKEVRAVPIPRLPAHMGALAMTVHKSQGSQFKHVAVVLAGRESPIQTRELVYTAVTRASQRVSWVGGADELGQALRRPVGRISGLGQLLWDP